MPKFCVTTTHRIPAPQHLWDAFRKAGSDHLLAKLTLERMRLIYTADPITGFVGGEGRTAEMFRLADVIRAARSVEHAAMVELAQAQADRVMGQQSEKPPLTP